MSRGHETAAQLFFEIWERPASLRCPAVSVLLVPAGFTANTPQFAEALVSELIACIVRLPASQHEYSIQPWKPTSPLWKIPKAALRANA